jgi:hypothetical protein
VNSSSSSPAQFNTPSFSTTGGVGGRTACSNVSLPQRLREEGTGRKESEGAEKGVLGVSRDESPGLMSKVACDVCPVTRSSCSFTQSLSVSKLFYAGIVLVASANILGRKKSWQGDGISWVFHNYSSDSCSCRILFYRRSQANFSLQPWSFEFSRFFFTFLPFTDQEFSLHPLAGRGTFSPHHMLLPVLHTLQLWLHPPLPYIRDLRREPGFRTCWGGISNKVLAVANKMRVH